MLRLFFFLTATIAFGICGCGGSDFPVAPVTGKVTCQGTPVTDATITFSPFAEGKSDVGKAANGTLNANGEFTLSTYGSNDGAVVGKHRVMISLENPYKKNACSTSGAIVLEVTNGRNHFDIELDKASQKK